MLVQIWGTMQPYPWSFWCDHIHATQSIMKGPLYVYIYICVLFFGRYVILLHAHSLEPIWPCESKPIKKVLCAILLPYRFQSEIWGYSWKDLVESFRTKQQHWVIRLGRRVIIISIPSTVFNITLCTYIYIYGSKSNSKASHSVNP